MVLVLSLWTAKHAPHHPAKALAHADGPCCCCCCHLFCMYPGQERMKRWYLRQRAAVWLQAVGSLLHALPHTSQPHPSLAPLPLCSTRIQPAHNALPGKLHTTGSTSLGMHMAAAGGWVCVWKLVWCPGRWPWESQRLSCRHCILPARVPAQLMIPPTVLLG